MRPSSHRNALLAALLGSLSAACAKTVGDDDPLPNQLDRLRVLAIAADPPDLVPGESATLEALVFQPDAGPAEYVWSWCPVRVDVESGLSCPIDEGLWAELWASAGLAGAPPAYDLGTSPTAVLQPGLEADSTVRLCQAVSELGSVAEPARVACVDGFEASITLRVRAGGDEEVATKSVPLLPAGVPPEARNHNPGPLGAVSARTESEEAPITDGVLRTGLEYALHVQLDEALSEVLPDEATGERRETLVLSWFVTPGKITELDADDQGFGPFDDDTQRTVYVPGQSPFDDLLENGWALPRGDQQTGELVLVLRDDRGGLAWRRDPFGLVAGEP